MLGSRISAQHTHILAPLFRSISFPKRAIGERELLCGSYVEGILYFWSLVRWTDMTRNWIFIFGENSSWIKYSTRFFFNSNTFIRLSFRSHLTVPKAKDDSFPLHFVCITWIIKRFSKAKKILHFKTSSACKSTYNFQGLMPVDFTIGFGNIHT